MKKKSTEQLFESYEAANARTKNREELKGEILLRLFFICDLQPLQPFRKIWGSRDPYEIPETDEIAARNREIEKTNVLIASECAKRKAEAMNVLEFLESRGYFHGLLLFLRHPEQDVRRASEDKLRSAGAFSWKGRLSRLRNPHVAVKLSEEV